MQTPLRRVPPICSSRLILWQQLAVLKHRHPCPRLTNADSARAFCQASPFVERKTEFFNSLQELTLEGEETVTFPVPWLYDDNGDATPAVGGYVVVTDFTGKPGALLRTTSVTTMPFRQVSEEFTRFEGPGARSPEAWREIHWNFYTRALRPSR